MLQTYEPDPCCGEPIAKSISRGELDDKDEWVCPNCGCVWKAAHAEGGIIKHWTASPFASVF